MTTRIAIFLFDQVEELDFAGPLEVLGMWALYFPDDEIEVFTVARDAGTITCALGTRVIPDHSWDSAPDFDVLVYPGGVVTNTHLGDESIRAWVRKAAASGTLMTSVCSGATVYADAGLLDSKPATTHWLVLDQLSGLGKDIEVRPDDRFVDTGDVITSAGVSAGIDMALHLIVRLHSEDRAREVKRMIQYEPAPPV